MSVEIIAEVEVPFTTASGRRTCVFGDQHGMSGLMAQLRSVAARAATDQGDMEVVFLGDIIDRGPDSIGCIDMAMSMGSCRGVTRVTALAGNHEELMATALLATSRDISQAAGMSWMRNGGIRVLAELGCGGKPREILAALGPERVSWLESLRTSHRDGGYLYVHAGLSPYDGAEQLDDPVGIDLTRPFEEDRSTRWVREAFHETRPPAKGWLDGAFVMHGHDPDDAKEMPPAETAGTLQRINLDGGSYRTGRTRMALVEAGRITVLEAS